MSLEKAYTITESPEVINNGTIQVCTSSLSDTTVHQVVPSEILPADNHCSALLVSEDHALATPNTVTIPFGAPLFLITPVPLQFVSESTSSASFTAITSSSSGCVQSHKEELSFSCQLGDAQEYVQEDNVPIQNNLEISTTEWTSTAVMTEVQTHDATTSTSAPPPCTIHAEGKSSADLSVIRKKLLDTVLDSQRKMSTDIAAMKNSIRTCSEVVNRREMNTSLPLPVTTVDALREFDDSLKDPKQKQQLVNYLNFVHGLHVKEAARQMMDRILTRSVAASINFSGAHDTFSFRKTILYSVLN
ncbi:unnamed protein product, partial [Dicrocoelium dendriticum]